LKIRELLSTDMDVCVSLLMETYNPPPWNDHWTNETGKRYLSDFISNSKFIGFVVVESDQIVGALFAHRKIWWTNDEIFIDELFIKPEHQRKGYGKMLMDKAEKISKELGLGGVTLLTNKYHPAKLFYEKNGYALAEHVIFMYKEVK
jgi:aminoglycoside 6'-N-acetyltransferase I